MKRSAPSRLRSLLCHSKSPSNVKFFDSFFFVFFCCSCRSLHQSESKTPKQRLLGWVQNKLPDMPIHNFRDDWNSGKALGALVDSCAPGNGRTTGTGVRWLRVAQVCRCRCDVGRTVSGLGDLGPAEKGRERLRSHAAGRRLAGHPAGGCLAGI